MNHIIKNWYYYAFVIYALGLIYFGGMFEMKALRIVINWVVLLSSPLWAFLVVWWVFFESLFLKKQKTGDYRAFIKGEKLFWK